MGEYEATIEKLNKVLTENGFANATATVLTPPRIKEGNWETQAYLSIVFDHDGKYVRPENGWYA